MVKETNHLTKAYRHWLEQATFFTIASHSAPNDGPVQNIDCSPRGDRAGSLVHIKDDKTLLIPDRKGNNRIDTLRNLVVQPDIALLFLTPGINEALRIKGTARLTTDPNLLALFTTEPKPVVIVIEVAISAVYFQCSRAAMRSGLWNSESFRGQQELPSPGTMLKEAGADIDAASYDKELQQRLQDL